MLLNSIVHIHGTAASSGTAAQFDFSIPDERDERKGDYKGGAKKGGGYKSSPNRGGHERFDRSGKGRSFGKGKDFGKKRRFDDDED